MRIRNSNFEIRIRNSESKFEKCLLTKLVTLPRAHIIDMQSPFSTFVWEVTTNVKPAAWQALVTYC